MSKSYKKSRQDDLSSNYSKKGNGRNNSTSGNGKRRASLHDLEDDSLQEMFASRFSNDCDD